MNVTCDKCNKRYSIADDKVRGKSVKIRCKQCQNLISVQGPSGPATSASSAASASAPVSAALDVASEAQLGGGQWEDERTRAMPMMDAAAQWFAMVKGKQLGPFDLKALEGRVKSGELTLRTYLWKQGMGDWKRASDVPEVSPVFAGVTSSVTATGPTASAGGERPSKKVAAVQRDVAVALETPSPEITRKSNGSSNGNGNGNGHGVESGADASAGQQVSAAPAPAVTRPKVASQSRVSAAMKPAVAPAPAPEPVKPEPAPQPKDAGSLSDLFGEGDGASAENARPAAVEARSTLDEGANDPGDKAGEEEGADEADKSLDPFAALGEADPSDAPPPGEATRFFIAQAGVNKRNPPWKIALFIFAFPAAIVGVLFILSSLHIVPMEVTRTNENGEEVKQSFFSAEGVSTLKDMLNGEAKKKADVERTKAASAAAAEVRHRAQTAAVAAADPEKVEKPEQPGAVDPRLALIYGPAGTPAPGGAKIHVRAENRDNQAATDSNSSGLTADATRKVIADKIKAFEGCVEQALRRNPNLAVGPIEVIANVGASGAVTSSNIDPAKYANSDWGNCMRDVAKRIVFPKSDGETEVRIPLKVGVAVPL